MPVRKATAEWKGNLKDGSGELATESGAIESAYSFPARFETGDGTNPEELIGAAYAGCFAMALSHDLASAGHKPESVAVEAHVHFDKVGEGFAITRIDLNCDARVPGIDAEAFQKQAQASKDNCPIANALASVERKLEARLVD